MLTRRNPRLEYFTLCHAAALVVFMVIAQVMSPNISNSTAHVDEDDARLPALIQGEQPEVVISAVALRDIVVTA